MGKFNAKCPRLKAFNHLQIIKITSKYHIDKQLVISYQHDSDDKTPTDLVGST